MSTEAYKELLRNTKKHFQNEYEYYKDGAYNPYLSLERIDKNSWLKAAIVRIEKEEFNIGGYAITSIVDNTVNGQDIEISGYMIHFMKNGKIEEDSGEFIIIVERDNEKWIAEPYGYTGKSNLKKRVSIRDSVITI